MAVTLPVPRHAWKQPTRLGLLGAAALAYTGLVDPNRSHAFPLCPLKLITGLDCPACGSLRATHSLLHAHLSEAAGHNLLFVLAVPFILLAWTTWFGSTVGWPVQRWRVPTRSWQALALTAGIFMAARNLPVPAFRLLASG